MAKGPGERERVLMSDSWGGNSLFKARFLMLCPDGATWHKETLWHEVSFDLVL